MIFAKPIPFEAARKVSQAKRVLPTDLDSAALRTLSKDIRRRAVFSAEVRYAAHLQKLKDLVTQIAEGPDDEVFADRAAGLRPLLMSVAEAKARLKEHLRSIGYHPGDKAETIKDLTSDRRLQLQVETNALDVMNHARWKAAQNPATLDQFPASELVRLAYPKGGEAAMRDWQARWSAVGGQFYGDRMIAMKNDPVWERLGSEFEDGLGNPWAPFAFSSGMGTLDVSREECEALGVPLRDQSPQDLGMNDNLEISADQFDEELRKLLEKRADLELDGDVLKLRATPGGRASNSGTSDGAYKGWETRRAKGWAPKPEEREEVRLKGLRAAESILKDHRDVLHAMERPDIGPIDFRWGDQRRGIEHIIWRREMQRLRFRSGPSGEEVVRMIPSVIAQGEPTFRNDGDVEIDRGEWRVVLTKRWECHRALQNQPPRGRSKPASDLHV
jgi:hypothetical protein